jgi:hypothetical protein
MMYEADAHPWFFSIDVAEEEFEEHDKILSSLIKT